MFQLDEVIKHRFHFFLRNIKDKQINLTLRELFDRNMQHNTLIFRGTGYYNKTLKSHFILLCNNNIYFKEQGKNFIAFYSWTRCTSHMWLWEMISAAQTAKPVKTQPLKLLIEFHEERLPSRAERSMWTGQTDGCPQLYARH